MSSVNYNLKNKGVRLISADEAWIKAKNGKQHLNPKYSFVGKVDTRLQNLIVTASDKKKPKFKGNILILDILYTDLTKMSRNSNAGIDKVRRMWYNGEARD